MSECEEKEKGGKNGTTHTTLSLYSFYADWHSMQHSPSSSISLFLYHSRSHTFAHPRGYSVAVWVILSLSSSCYQLWVSPPLLVSLAIVHVSLSHCIGLRLSHLALLWRYNQLGSMPYTMDHWLLCFSSPLQRLPLLLLLCPFFLLSWGAQDEFEKDPSAFRRD